MVARAACIVCAGTGIGGVSYGREHPCLVCDEPPTRATFCSTCGQGITYGERVRDRDGRGWQESGVCACPGVWLHGVHWSGGS